jgi:hypothetical protein
MPSTPSRSPITPYERAVCYYTLPKVTHPVTLGLIAIYALCVLEALAAFSYGIASGDMDWTTMGAYSFAGIVGFGLAAFFVRALLNDVRERKALAEARHAPMMTPAEDLPDPFAEHLLLKHSPHAPASLFECTMHHDTARYTVEAKPSSREWLLRTPDTARQVRVQVLRGVQSFSFSMNRPALMAVYRDDQEVARIKRHGGLTETQIEITSATLSPKQILVRNRGIYVGGALRGRIYTLRGDDYLDVHRDALNDALLGYFATLT